MVGCKRKRGNRQRDQGGQMVRAVPPLMWQQTPAGTWISHGQQFGYELVHNPKADELWPGQDEPLYNVRVWRLLSPRESRVIGGYRGLDHAKRQVEKDEANPKAYYKNLWFELMRSDKSDDDYTERGGSLG